MKRIKADVWDSGNSMTRFYEVIRECVICNGTGETVNPEAEGGIETCYVCNGQGEVVYYD